MSGNKPLSGIRVLDFTELAPGPFFTQCMLDLGAEVNKIERPPHGDMARRLSPGGHALLNVGKRSLFLDLKDKSQAAQVDELIKESDVLAEGFRPGVMDRLGYGYERVSALNPRIVYVSITGFGQDGPYANLPGHDVN